MSENKTILNAPRRSVLGQDFFAESALEIAPKLLGKYIVMKHGKKQEALQIFEVEAYGGDEDKAARTFHGKTPGNAMIFENPGFWYVHLTYGVHFMLNVVVDENGRPGSVFFRGAVGETGRFDGPGKLTKHLGINKRYHGAPLRPETGLWIEDRGAVVSKKEIVRSPRVGLGKVDEIWKMKPYRFQYKTL